MRRVLAGAFLAALFALCLQVGTFPVMAAQAPSQSPSPQSPPSGVAAKGSPNIVVILLDDMGFGDTSAFGGAAQTPALERLAAQGLKYNNFNTTALCSPTRAALLTGRNHHRVGFGVLADVELQDAPPGYDTIWKRDTASIARVLRGRDYSTAAIGKWHNTPIREVTPTGPFERWPTGLGFDYFYGFMQGLEDQWEPSSLYQNTAPVEPKARPGKQYNLDADLVDHAIQWVGTHRASAAGKPYFLYFASAAAHFPHQVPKEWINRYRGKFDQGWNRLREQTFERQKALGVIPAEAKLTPWPQKIPDWDALSADEKRFCAREMEVYAAYIAHADHEVGRLLKTVMQDENTLIFYIVGDNGAGPNGVIGHMDIGFDAGSPRDPERVRSRLQQIDELGGPLHQNNYATGWGWAGGTPFKGLKGMAAYFGGVRNPLVVAWSGHIKDPGGLRTQFTHVTDVVATIYDVLGVELPDSVDGVRQQPLDGVSFLPSFADSQFLSRHRTQYFEMGGSRAIYQDGWIALAQHDRSMFDDTPTAANLSQDRWELYDVAKDFSESDDVSAQYPEKLQSLRAVFDAEGSRNDVFPLQAGIMAGKAVHSINEGRVFTYASGQPRIPARIAPDFQRSHRITASLVIPDKGAQGVIASYGGRWGGFTLYVKNNHLVYESNLGGQRRDVIRSNIALPKGHLTVAYDFARTDGGADGTGGKLVAQGTGTLYVDGRPVGESSLRVAPPIWLWGTFGVGQAYGSPVSTAWQTPFEFTGIIEGVKVELR